MAATEQPGTKRDAAYYKARQSVYKMAVGSRQKKTQQDIQIGVMENESMGLARHK